MTTAGPNNPGTVVSDSIIGDSAWASPEQAKILSGTSSAVLDFVSSQITTEYLKATNFGFTLPTSLPGIVVDGIEVEVHKSASFSSATVKDNSVRVVQSGTIAGTDLKDTVFWPTIGAYKTYGGSSELWGLSWTSADIDGSGFGVAVSGQLIGSGSETANISHVRITVHWHAETQNLTVTGITSKEFIGTPVVAGPVVINNGIGSEEAVGSLVIGNRQFADPSAIGGGEAFGDPGFSASVSAHGVGSLETFGTQQINLTLFPSSVSTGEIFGSQIVGVEQYIDPTSLVSAEAFGSHQISALIDLEGRGISSKESVGFAQANLSVIPSTIVGEEVIGAASVDLVVLPSSFLGGETFGTQQVDLTIFPASVVSVETFGAVGLSGPVNVTSIVSTEVVPVPLIELFLVSGSITTDEVLGVGLVYQQQFIDQSGLSSAEALGAVGVELLIFPGGIASAELMGSVGLDISVFATPVLTQELFGDHFLDIAVPGVGGIGSREIFGTPVIVSTIHTVGIAGAEQVSSARLDLVVFPGATESLEALGDVDVDLILFMPSLGSGEVPGTPQVNLHVLSVGGITTLAGVSSSQVNHSVAVMGISGEEVFGVPQLNLFLATAGISGAETFGLPLLTTNIIVPGIASLEAVGSPTLDFTAVIPASITSDEAFGLHWVYFPGLPTESVCVAAMDAFKPGAIRSGVCS